MKRAIICFSGTGNSLAVAQLLAETLDDTRLIYLEHDTLTEMLAGRIEINADNIIWVCPVYSWGLPPVMIRVMEHADITPGAVHDLVVTCGDDCGLVTRQWIDLMTSRGFDATAAYSVQMPNTYVVMVGFDVDKPAIRNAKLDAFVQRTKAVAESIKRVDRCDDTVRGSFAWIKSRVIYPWFMRHYMSSKPFNCDTRRCTGCGLCARSCPLDNITMRPDPEGQRPSWGDNCTQCLRCYHICPTHAVRYGKATDKKGQYIYSKFKKNRLTNDHTHQQ